MLINGHPRVSVFQLGECELLVSWDCTCAVGWVKERPESCSIWRYCAEYNINTQTNNFSICNCIMKATMQI